MYLLDTNVVSELRKANSGKASPRVVEWVASVDPIDLYLSAITVLEIEQSVLSMERKDRRQGERLRFWLDTQVIPAFGTRILPVDVAVARRCARLHVPDPHSERDALIAATAIVHGLTVVSRNTADFSGTGVDVYDPWNRE